MRLVVQRVKHAKVTDLDTSKAVGEIGLGLFVLIGVEKGDTMDIAHNLAKKVLKLRIMSDAAGKMNLSVTDIGGEILVVSQFTLLADSSFGNRPSFVAAANLHDANGIYELFVKKISESGLKIQTGKFGAYMQIDAFLDGPVTILL